jgi:sodium/hydrogen antiporter
MVLAAKLLARLQLSSAMIYLALGFALGPAGLELITLDPLRHAGLIERVAEVAVLISLFTVGLRMGQVPLLDRRWLLPLRLAFLAMALTVGLVALVGVMWLDLPLGAAVLLGAILAPTDPVLASGVKTEGGADPGRLRFSLAGEGGLNDGTALPFVFLGLGLMGLHELGPGGWRWWTVDLLWATGGGLLIGAGVGTLIGTLVVRLRTRHHLAVGLDEFLSLGLVAVTYGAAQLCLASGFLAVFAAGLALQRVREQPRVGSESLGATDDPGGHGYRALATHSHHASATMTDAVQGFNEQLERLAELAVVVLVGAMLPYASNSFPATWAPWAFIAMLFLLLRPAAVLVGTLGEPMGVRQRGMVCWFGIRGIGSIYYLMFAVGQGVSGPVAQQLLALTLLTVASSVVAHGISVRALMSWYLQHKPRPAT